MKKRKIGDSGLEVSPLGILYSICMIAPTTKRNSNRFAGKKDWQSSTTFRWPAVFSLASTARWPTWQTGPVPILLKNI